MRRIIKLGLITIIAAFFTTGLVSAVSEWAIGDEVQLSVTTTNRGTVDVVESYGNITIRSPGGMLFDSGAFYVDDVIPPGETVVVPVNWDSSEAVPGEYDIILDGFLVYANDKTEDTYNVFEDVFRLYDGLTGLRAVPEKFCSLKIDDVLVFTETCYQGSDFLVTVFFENTGTLEFIPEISVTLFTGNITYPLTNHTYLEPCRPGFDARLYRSKLPDDIQEGAYRVNVSVRGHFYDPFINSTLYQNGLEGFYKDYFKPQGVGEMHNNSNPFLSPYFDTCKAMHNASYWPEPNISEAYRVCANGTCLAGPSSGYSLFGGRDYHNGTNVKDTCEAFEGFRDYWEDRGVTSGFNTSTCLPRMHNSTVLITGRKIEYRARVLVNNTYVRPGEGFRIGVEINNTGIGFEPEFRLKFNEDDLLFKPFEIVSEEPIGYRVFVNEDNETVGWSRFELQVKTSEEATVDSEYKLIVSVSPVEVYEASPLAGLYDTWIEDTIFTIVDSGNIDSETVKQILSSKDTELDLENIEENSVIYMQVIPKDGEEGTEPVETPDSPDTTYTEPDEPEDDEPRGFSLKSIFDTIWSFFSNLFG